jgi:hypothetical protein
MERADVDVTKLSAYCTGDWHANRRIEHAREVT